LQHGSLKRESLWTNNLAVGSREYIEENQGKFGRQYKITALPAPAFEVKQYGQIRVKNVSSFHEKDSLQDYVISEPQIAYNTYFPLENWVLSGEMQFFWTIVL